jgi:RNA polymerase sigma-70 factor (ECF subfamily)
MRALYDGCHRRLVAQVYAITADLSEAQDAVQEAFVRALAAPRRFGRVDNPEAWLRVVAVNVARRRFRRRAHLDRLLRRIPPAPPAVEPEGLTPDHLALVAALRRLPAAQREAVALHHLADLPIAEVAELTGVAVGTVKARLSRGRARLAELLAEDEPAGPARAGAGSPRHSEAGGTGQPDRGTGSVTGSRADVTPAGIRAPGDPARASGAGSADRPEPGNGALPDPAGPVGGGGRPWLVADCTYPWGVRAPDA